MAACAEIIKQAMDKPDGAILLLDGIDEVPEAHERRHQLPTEAEWEWVARGVPCRDPSRSRERRQRFSVLRCHVFS